MNFPTLVRLVSLVVFLCAFVAGPRARADVVPPDGCSATDPDVPLCSGKKAGDVCTFASGTTGHCTALRCTTDAGVAQLKCVAQGVTQPGTGCALAGRATATPWLALSLGLCIGGLLVQKRRRGLPRAQ